MMFVIIKKHLAGFLIAFAACLAPVLGHCDTTPNWIIIFDENVFEGKITARQGNIWFSFQYQFVSAPEGIRLEDESGEVEPGALFSADQLSTVQVYVPEGSPGLLGRLVFKRDYRFWLFRTVTRNVDIQFPMYRIDDHSEMVTNYIYHTQKAEEYFEYMGKCYKRYNNPENYFQAGVPSYRYQIKPFCRSKYLENNEGTYPDNYRDEGLEYMKGEDRISVAYSVYAHYLASADSKIADLLRALFEDLDVQFTLPDKG